MTLGYVFGVPPIIRFRVRHIARLTHVFYVVKREVLVKLELWAFTRRINSYTMEESRSETC